MSGHLFDWGIKLIVKLLNTPLTMYIFLNANMLQLVSISESDMSSDSGNSCVGTRIWRQQTTRHINVCSHLKCHWWRWNQTRKHLLQSILSGYLNSRAMIFLSQYGPVARTSNLLRLHFFWTSPCISNGVSGCSQVCYRISPRSENNRKWGIPRWRFPEKGELNRRLGTHCEITLRWMPQNLPNEESALVQVMAWCCQATSHYLSQCWPIFM